MKILQCVLRQQNKRMHAITSISAETARGVMCYFSQKGSWNTIGIHEVCLQGTKWDAITITYILREAIIV